MMAWQGCAGRSKYYLLLIALCISFVVPSGMAQAHDIVHHSSAVNNLVGFDQRLNEEVPGELRFLDESGKSVTLGSYFAQRPVILALSYFECETLCPLVRHGLVEALRPLTFGAGDQFDVVLVSIDPDETPMTAQLVKQETVANYDRVGSEDGWHFLTGDHDTIDRLAEAIGFRYAYDVERDEYAHASGVVVITPEGRIARYFYGIEYDSQDLRLGVVEASQNRIGSAIDQLLLLCFHYDPTVGKYNFLIMNVVRAAGVITVAAIGLAIFMLSRKDPQKERTATLG